MEEWRSKYHPISRLRNYMMKRGWWSEEEETATIKQTRVDVLKALSKAENEKKPHLDGLFEDVYSELTPNLIEQKKELHQHLEKYPNYYPLDLHER